MSLEQFEAHLRDPAPGFRCSAGGDRSGAASFLARVTHRVGRAATAKAIETISKYSGLGSALKAFVERHDGLVLYMDDRSDAAGVTFFKVSDWKRQNKEMRESMADMGFEKDDMPDWFHTGIVFGEIPHSANYLVIEPDGDDAGQIFYCDHDDFKTEPLAESFDDFLRMIVGDPPGFLYQCGCFTRYSDGKTKTQWIPEEYLPDCRGA